MAILGNLFRQKKEAEIEDPQIVDTLARNVDAIINGHMPMQTTWNFPALQS